MHRMLREHPDLMALVELIDIDENEALAKQHRIRAVPTSVRADGERKVGGMASQSCGTSCRRPAAHVTVAARDLAAAPVL